MGTTRGVPDTGKALGEYGTLGSGTAGYNPVLTRGGVVRQVPVRCSVVLDMWWLSMERSVERSTHKKPTRRGRPYVSLSFAEDLPWCLQNFLRSVLEQ